MFCKNTRAAIRAGTAMVAVLALGSTPAFAQDESRVVDPDSVIVVTGVFGERAIENAPISIESLSGDELTQAVPVSSADLLKKVPGVYVNSAFGEIRNVVFSRGVSANSADAASGYYYVSFQENGMPVEPVTFGNFGPDFFLRPDLMLDRVEALRGGTSVVTGSNAPGGIFNYVQRTGKSFDGTQLQARIGLEGDGSNPYYRGDFYTGGELSDGLYYAVGGFYRQSEGARDPGYDSNRGGQIQANLRWEYGDGSLTFHGRYLNDRNSFFEFLPAFDYDDPQIAPGFDNSSTVLPVVSGAHPYVDFGGVERQFDPSDLVHSTSYSAGVDWEHDFGSAITLSNKFRYTNNRSEWNSGAVVFATPVNDFFSLLQLGLFGLPGTTTYRFGDTGAIAAETVSVSGFDNTVTVNNLPNQNILADGVITGAGFTPNNKSESFSNQFAANLRAGNHTITAGAFVSFSQIDSRNGSAGVFVTPLAPSAQPLDITFTATDGTIYQVTDPSGYGGHGGRGILDGDGHNGSQDQISFFIGDTWEATDRLSIDVGLRYEILNYDITNLTKISPPDVLASGGADGNILTLYDNGLYTLGTPTNVKRDYDFLNYTASIAYEFTDDLLAYIRYTRGEKAPDYGLIQTLDTADEIANVFPEPQVIQQVELGFKYSTPDIRVSVFPFYSKLSNVGTTQLFTDSDGAVYSPAPQFGSTETFGVEISGDADVTDWFNLRAALTLQDPTSSGFGTYIANTPSRDDDVLVSIPEGDADVNPKILANLTATFTPTESSSLFIEYSYLGERAANQYNAFYLPDFSTVNLGARYDFGDSFRLQANVTNVFNVKGVYSWAPSGSFLGALDRQALTPEAVAASPDTLFSIVPSQPRAFFLTGTVTF